MSSLWKRSADGWALRSRPWTCVVGLSEAAVPLPPSSFASRIVVLSSVDSGARDILTYGPLRVLVPPMDMLDGDVSAGLWRGGDRRASVPMVRRRARHARPRVGTRTGASGALRARVGPGRRGHVHCL